MTDIGQIDRQQTYIEQTVSRKIGNKKVSEAASRQTIGRRREKK